MSDLGKILVTGADGFIGSHLVEALVRAGHDVRAFVLYNSFNSWGWLDQSDFKAKLDVFAGDIRDAHGVRTAMKDCRTVLHLAALVSVPHSYHSPQTYVETNINGTLNVVQAAHDLAVRHVVVTSTSEVYGTAQRVPIAEDHPLNAQSPYAASKIGADQLALSFHRAMGTPVSVIRPFNTYGPRQSARAVIPTIVTQILAGRTELDLGALSPTRDFSYIDDTVAGFIALAGAKAGIGQVLNLGAGFEISIGDLAALIADIMGAKIKIAADAQRVRPAASEVERLLSDNTKARTALNWSPAYAGTDGLRRGLEKTISWFSDPTVRKLYKAELYNI